MKNLILLSLSFVFSICKSQTTINIEPPTDDAYIYQLSPVSNNNYGTSIDLIVGKDVNSYELRTLIKWDLSSLPSCINISNAQIRLDQTTSDPSIVVDIYRINQSWNESSVTWLNRPSDITWIGSITFSATPGLKYIPATSLVQDWLTLGNNGIMFIINLGSNGDLHGFDSKEASSSDPRLIITYTSATPPNVSINATNTSCGQNNGSVTANVSGGTSPYNYLWDNGCTNSNCNNLSAGNYSVTIIDANNCTAIDNSSISSSSFSINPTNINVNPNSGNTSFIISATNSSWSISENCSWLSASPTSGTNNGTINISYNSNTSVNRSCAINISCGTNSEIVTINQSELTSINELTADNFNIYPNPNVGKFIIENSKIENLEIKILNIFGQIIFNQKYFTDKIEINLPEQENGIYFLIIETKKEVLRRKIFNVGEIGN